MRLQGMNPTEFKVAVSVNQLGRQLGNTMSVNVLERLFARILPAAKLARKSQVKDRWANGQALKKLAATRGRGFKAMSAQAKKAIQKGGFLPTRSLKRSADESSSASSKRARR